VLEQFRQRRLEVVEALGALCDTARAVGAGSLAARIDREVIDKLEADRFHLVVVGEFNHGKTTLVNALLGSAVLPVGVTPTTAVIHHLVYAGEPRARLVMASGAEQELPFSDVAAFAAGHARSPDRGTRSASEASGGRGGTERPLAAEGRTGPVSYLEVGYPAELLRERVVLVDTPGVNDLSLTRAEITYGYIPRSDAVLFVLDAGQPVKESERQFLEKQLIGKSRDKIVFVVAKRDIWSPAERDEAVAYVRERLSSLVADPPIFAVSAQAALGGKDADTGLDELKLHLTRFLAEERGRILLDNALGEGLGAAGVLSRGIDARRRAAGMSAEQLARRVSMLERDLSGHADTIEKRRLSIREESGAIKAWARRDLDRFCDDVVSGLPAVLERASGEDLKQHLGAFLEHSFREWAKAETAEIATSLEQLAERMVALVRDDAHDVGGRVSEAMGADLQTPSIEVDTFGYDLGVFAMLSVGLGMLFANALLGGLMLAAAPVLALWNRDRTAAEIRKRALELAPVVLREAAGKVGPKIDEMVEEFAERLDAWVVTAGQELHREIIEVLASVREERAHGASDADKERADCDRQAERLGAARQRMQALREAMAAPERAEAAGANAS
jgi:GTPase SAR1 family protein